MVDNGTEDGTNIHNVGALCQTQGKKFIPASFYQVNVIILTTEKSRGVIWLQRMETAGTMCDSNLAADAIYMNESPSTL